MGKIHNAECLDLDQARLIENPSEQWFAVMFFKSVLYKLGYLITHEKEEFYTQLRGRTRSTLVDFEIKPSTSKYIRVDTEVTKSLNLHGKIHQRQVMRRVVRPDKLAYVQFPWKLLMAPSYCFDIIRQISEGEITNQEASRRLSESLHDPNFETEYHFPPGEFHN